MQTDMLFVPTIHVNQYYGRDARVTNGTTVDLKKKMLFFWLCVRVQMFSNAKETTVKRGIILTSPLKR
jgi:hypothetical protein